jgi:hypothetical protein
VEGAGDPDDPLLCFRTSEMRRYLSRCQRCQYRYRRLSSCYSYLHVNLARTSPEFITSCTGLSLLAITLALSFLCFLRRLKVALSTLDSKLVSIEMLPPCSTQAQAQAQASVHSEQ